MAHAAAPSPSALKRTFAALASDGARRGICCAQRADAVTAGALYAVKLVRFMALWIAIYTVDKIWRDLYVQSVVRAGDGADPRPPSLRWLLPAALGIELVFMCAVVVCVLLLDAAYGGGGTRFVLDACFIRLLVLDYLLTSALMLAVALVLTSVAQDPQLFRYRDDGMRAVRATCSLLLQVAAVVLALPLYRIA